MVSRIQLPSLQELDIIPDCTVEGKYKIRFKTFISFLRKHSTSTEKDLGRIENIRRTFQKLLKGHFFENGEEYISLTSCLRFIFNQYDKIDVCQKITHEIEQSLLNCASQPNVIDHSILDIYKAAAKLDITHETSLGQILVDSLSDSDIPSLYYQHKIGFDQQEWERIKLFEWHFAKLEPNHASQDLAEGIKRRQSFLNECKSLLDIQPVLQNVCKTTINTNSARKAAADLQNGILLTGRSVHIPTQVDATLLAALHEIFPNVVQKVVCVACQTPTCTHDKGLHVYIELSNHGAQSFPDICVIITSHLNTCHTEHCPQIVWLKDGTLSQYGDPVQRFHLHDDWALGKLNTATISAPVFENLDNSSEDVCSHCCSVMYHKHPLDWKRFSIADEWMYHVPLFVQIIFGSFINQDSFKRATTPSEYLANKVQRLYSTFDILLNILNRCYCGINQELSSDELSVSYHSVNTVFSITSQGGITCSFPESEKRLKRQADPSVLYYRAYIDKYPMEYETSAGTILKSVSLRDCHLVLCVDNLVRLTFHKDANRGESRSSQICTLPITLMGIPKDSVVVQSWHDSGLCDGSDKCLCKEPVTLKPEDFSNVFIDPTVEEKAQMDFFQLSITWGLSDLWKAFENYPDVLSTLNIAIESQGMSTVADHDEGAVNTQMDEMDVGDLNQSMQSLVLGEMDASLLDHSLSSIGEESIGTDSEPKEYSSDCDHGETKHSSSEHTDGERDENFDDSDCSCYDGLISGVQALPPSPEPVSESGTVQDIFQNALPTDVLQDTVTSLGFKVFKPPPLLCRHPPPMEGRDDDPKVLREILRDIMMKTGKLNDCDRARILFGPDNKIGKNLFKIMASDDFFRNYLPEFPLLHLRKSKIRNLCSGYEDSGLYYLLGFMQNRELDMTHLVSMQNIEDATRNIRRISFSLHLAFIIKFLEYLPTEEAQLARKHLSEDLMDCSETRLMYHKKYSDFLENTSKSNATFALHKEMMYHCDEVLAISMAERIGGPDGYNLLLAAVKSSLPFSFLNGASSYAAFCCNLLHEHYTAGPFHEAMKKTLFSTPFKGSKVNFGLDTQREMDHREAIKGFRPRATPSSVLPRMSLVDTFASFKTKNRFNSSERDVTDNSNDCAIRTWRVTKKDVSHIVPTALLILRQGGLSLDPDSRPRNVYDAKKTYLSEAALDMNTYQIGEYLVKRFAHLNEMCGLSKVIPSLDIEFPKPLVTKVKNMTDSGYTVRRMKCQMSTNTGDKEKKEIKRQKRAKHLSAVANCLTSDMNLCQAVVKPDCTKATVNKASGMKNALISLLTECLDQELNIGNENCTKRQKRQRVERNLSEAGIVKFACTELSSILFHKVKVVVVEFAGVKFKSGTGTGTEYIQHVETNIINKTLRDFPNAERMVICEEKYSFTPDAFKAATRTKRKKTTKNSIVHLKRGSEIISLDVFDKQAACSTSEGKALISTFLAANVNKLNVKRSLILDIDSEWIMEACKCVDQGKCKCQGCYAVPIRTRFDSRQLTDKSKLGHIHQRKGEAEMAQVDWLMDALPDLKEGDSVVSLVTSGDIDAVPIHLFAIAQHWPRRDDNTFNHPVFVILTKPKGSHDVYNITQMIEVLERSYGTGASMKIAVVLCSGGNDFMLKFNGISHEKMLLQFVRNSHFMEHLMVFQNGNQSEYVNKNMFRDFMKALYCPSKLMPSKLSTDHVRQLSVKRPGQKTLSKPQKWMPPNSALDSIASLIDLQIEYLYTAGCHSAKLPNFILKGCLKEDGDGNIGYDLGDKVHIANPENLLEISEIQMKEIVRKARPPSNPKGKSYTGSRKRGPEDTPQKGRI